MKNLLFGNLSLKILSLLFAVSLWLFVNLKATAERTLQVPVTWENQPDFLRITNTVGDSCRVRVSGPRRILSHLDPARFPVELDLSDAQVGLSSYQINEKMVHMPPGVTATVLPPDTIQFKFELVVKRTVDVKPRLLGSPPEGYVLKAVEVKPERVEIVGAQSEVQGVFEISTQPIDVRDLREDRVERVPVAVHGAHVWVEGDNAEVEVHLLVEQRPLERLLRNLPVRVENATGKVRVIPPRVDVRLRGMAAQVERIRPDQLTVYVSLPENGGDGGLLPVAFRISQEGVLAESRPAEVRVERAGTESPSADEPRDRP